MMNKRLHDKCNVLGRSGYGKCVLYTYDAYSSHIFRDVDSLTDGQANLQITGRDTPTHVNGLINRNVCYVWQVWIRKVCK